MSGHRRSRIAVAVTAIIASVQFATAAELADTVALDITAQSLDRALLRFSEQTGIQVLMSTEIVEGKTTRGVRGQLTAEQALQQLLEGSGLQFRPIDRRAVTIAEKAGSVGADASIASNNTRVAWVQEGQGVSGNQASNDVQPAFVGAQQESASDGRKQSLEEVVVTGSHIRGAQNLSSPVITFDRNDIEAGGFTTTQQLIQKLPQNLNNVSDATQANLNGGVGYAANPNGTAVNLRGLGGDATLVLLNGRRLAAAGNGSYVDISLVPISAIERVEVLTDGASAIYGADAVGGVVNLVLREDFEGRETQVRYGSVTDGRHNELQASQTIGHSWGSGSGFLTYDFLHRTRLESRDRSQLFAPTVMPTTTLLPEQKRQGALAVLNQNVSEGIELSSSVFFAQRNSEMSNTLDFGVLMLQDSFVDARQLGATSGLRVDLTNDWQVRVSGVFDETQSRFQLFDGLTGSRLLSTTNAFSVWSADVAADGPLTRVPGGDMRLALGVHTRSEDLRQDSGPIYQAQLDRDNKAVYAEVLVPWFTGLNRRTGLEHLELTVAARYEDYSDFGHSFNPKVGLAWSPMRGLNMRGTWGTSFKAPLLNQMTHTDSVFVMDGMFRNEFGTTPVLQVEGNGVNLGPEESRSWTVGFDFTPEMLPQLSLSITYFDIDYEERISAPLPSDPTGILLDPMYASVVTRDPDRAAIERFISGALSVTCFSYVTYDYCDATDMANSVTAIVDGRLRNIAGLQMNGFDFSAGYRFSMAGGDWGIKVSGSKLLENRKQLVPGGPQVDELNNVWMPVDLRLQSALSFSRGGLNVLAAINYTDEYQDSRAEYVGTPLWRSHVSSWTTVDLTVNYDLASFLPNQWSVQPKFTLSAQNIFDREPPYVANYNGFRYDGANASALGRFVSAQFGLRW